MDGDKRVGKAVKSYVLLLTDQDAQGRIRRGDYFKSVLEVSGANRLFYDCSLLSSSIMAILR